jgi:transposase InsO family protein
MKYAKGEAKGKGSTIELGGKGQELHVGPMQDVLLPVYDVNGQQRLLKERGSFAKGARYPLLACADRPVVLRIPGRAEEVQGVDDKGARFWIPVKRVDGLPVISIASKGAVVEQTRAGKGLAAWSSMSPKEALQRKEKMSDDERAELLGVLHKRLAHATGRRLYLTLKEKGWGGLFTEKECGQVDCEVCRLLNRKRTKVPRVKDALRGQIGPGQEAYQDLTELPKGTGGFRYVSVIIDAYTRRVSAWALKSKDEALVHCVAYVRRLEKEGTPVKFWHSDNGGEFANKAYSEFLTKEGIAHDFGAPYTPETQGLVERANGVFKRLLGKTLRALNLPVYLWPGLLPGVVAAMNGVVHAVLGESPCMKAKDARASAMPEMALGDVVSVVDPHDKQAVEGYFGGAVSPQVVTVLVKPKGGGWRIMRVHPTAVKLVAWQGRGCPQGVDDRTAGSSSQREGDVEAVEYVKIDGDEYTDGGEGQVGEEEPILADEPQRDGDHKDDELIIAPGYGVVVEGQGATPYAAQILKAYKQTVKGAKLSKEDGKWEHSELITFRRGEVKRSFPLSGGEEIHVPAQIEALLQGDEAEGDDGGQRAEVVPDVSSDKGDAEGIETVDVLHGSDDEAEGQVALTALTARALTATRLPILPENKAKNQVEASKVEVAEGSHKAGDMKELRSYAKWKVLGPKVTKVTRRILAKTFPAGWRRTWKGIGNSRVPKSRLYVQGFRDKRDMGWLETYSGTMDPGLMRLGLIYALVRKWRLAQSDVEAAFLQTPSDEELYLKMPDDLPQEAIELGYEPKGVYPQLAAVYGRVDAPKLYTDSFKKAAEEIDLTEEAQSILVQGVKDDKITGILLMHMDDKLNAAEDPEANLKELDKTFKMSSIDVIKESQVFRYTGLDIVWEPSKGLCTIGQEGYAAELKTTLTDKQRRKVFGVADLKQTEPGAVEPEYGKAQQAWTGVLGWLAKTQRHLSVVFSEISKNSNKPCYESVVAAMRACEYAKKHHKPLVLEAIEEPAVVCWVDASFDVKTCGGRLGWELQIVEASSIGSDISSISVNNVVAWRSKRLKRKVASTTSAELMALVEGTRVVPAYVRLIECLWRIRPKVVFVTDNQPLLAWLSTGWVDHDPSLQGVLDLARSRLHDVNGQVLWVPTHKQRADKHN